MDIDEPHDPSPDESSDEKAILSSPESEDENPDEAPEPRDRFQLFVRRLDWKLVGMILLIKGLLFIFAARGFQILEDKKADGIYGALEIWNRWDSANYIKLAQNGYLGQGEMRPLLVFYPLLPWLTRYLSLFVGDYLISALLISTVASIATGLLLKDLVRLDHSEETAQRAVWFLFIFPTSYFLHIGYTESLFLTFSLGSFLAARKDRWLLAVVLGALACLTRATGLVLIPALAFEAFAQYRATNRINWRWAAIPLIILGFGCYLLLIKHATGDAFAFISIRKQFFYISSTWPWIGVPEIFGAFNRTPAQAELIGMQELLFVTLGAVCAFASFALLRASYAVWIAGNWLLITSVTFIASVPRYTLVMFPIFILFAKLSKRPLWNVVITVWSLLNLSLFTIEFVRGRWAF